MCDCGGRRDAVPFLGLAHFAQAHVHSRILRRLVGVIIICQELFFELALVVEMTLKGDGNKHVTSRSDGSPCVDSRWVHGALRKELPAASSCKKGNENTLATAHYVFLDLQTSFP